MIEWNACARHFHIRDASSAADYRAVEQIQKEAWGFDDLDVVPMSQLVAAQWTGGMVLCAFQDDQMIGFIYGFPSHEDGHPSIHSHMLAVRRECRNLNAGFYLKFSQRERALELGVSEITWTFDPLQSLNAHLNFAKLGVLSFRYVPNFYSDTSSPLHQGFSLDRLWVTWSINSERVKQHIREAEQAIHHDEPNACPRGNSIDAADALVRSEGGRPLVADFTNLSQGDRCLIEIPGEINELKQNNLAAALEWREATRAAFMAAIEAGFVVEEFLKLEGERGPRRVYVLRRR